MNFVFIALKRKNKLEMSASEEFRYKKYLGSLKEGLYDIIIKKHKNKRTLDQNAYYFGVVLSILSDYFGYEVDEMHEEMKLKFNPVKSKINTGLLVGGSTKKMNTEEFSEYIEKIRRWAAIDYQIEIPDPKRIEIT